jgi:iron complex outermembrane receptor protein
MPRQASRVIIQGGECVTKARFCVVTALPLIAALACQSPAAAQDAPDAPAVEELGEGDVIVTARRQDEKLRDVPASITVLTADAIAQTGARVAADFVQLTPGVSIVAGNTEAADTQINIRGLNGARDAESNVALVVDGILKSNTSSLSQDQGALQQMEVLKGPQSAIYGRNAEAGAIVLTTKRPGDRLEGSGRISYGNNETVDAGLVLSGPLGDSLGFVLNGDYRRTDGFYRNVFLGSAQNSALYPGQSTDRTSVDDGERWNINGRLIWSPDDATEFDLKGRYGEVRSSAISFNAVFQLPTLAAATGVSDFNIDVNDHKFVFTNNIDPENVQNTIEASLRLSHDFSDMLSFTGYAAYSSIQNHFYADGTSGTFGFFNAEPNCIASMAALDGYPVQAPFGIGGGAFLPPYSPVTCDGTQYQQRDQEDFSVEGRFQGEMDRLRWQLGGYYLHINRRTCINLGLDTGQGVVEKCYTSDPRNPTEALADDSFKTDVYAAFGSADVDLTDQLKAGLALRYDIEQRRVENNVPVDARTLYVGNVLTGVPNGTPGNPANYYLNVGLDPAYNPGGRLSPRNATFRQLEPKVTISYKPDPLLTLYANWGVGFKSGGFNNGGSQAVVQGFFNAAIGSGLSIFDDYKKERSSAWEAGIKGSTPNGALSWELAGYYTTVRDQQFFEFFVGPFGLLRVVSNIDKTRLYGAEASANFRIVSGWTIFASGNYTDSRIQKNSARPYTVGNESPYTAKYTINAGTQLDKPVTDGFNITARADVRVTGPTWFHTVQNNTVPNIFTDQVGLGTFTNSKRDAFTTVNLRLGVKGEAWSLQAFANNVFDQDYLVEVIPAPEFGGGFVAPGNRRAYGVEAGFRF